MHAFSYSPPFFCTVRSMTSESHVHWIFILFLSLLQNSDISVLQICQYFRAAMKSAAVSTTVRNRAFMCIQQSQTQLFPTTSKTTSIMPLVHTNICPSWKLFFFQFCYNLRYLSLRKKEKTVTAANAYQKLKIKHMIKKTIIVSISPKVNVKVKL